MYRRIMVAVDGSEISDRAFSEALAQAREAAGDLRVLHVIDVNVIYMGGEGVSFEAMYEAWRQEGEAILSKATAKALEAGVKPEIALVPSAGRRVSEVILDEARDWGADVIVIGTHGRRGFSRLFLGSVAEGVTRTSPLPVLLVRGE